MKYKAVLRILIRVALGALITTYPLVYYMLRISPQRGHTGDTQILYGVPLLILSAILATLLIVFVGEVQVVLGTWLHTTQAIGASLWSGIFTGIQAIFRRIAHLGTMGLKGISVLCTTLIQGLISMMQCLADRLSRHKTQTLAVLVVVTMLAMRYLEKGHWFMTVCWSIMGFLVISSCLLACVSILRRIRIEWGAPTIKAGQLVKIPALVAFIALFSFLMLRYHFDLRSMVSSWWGVMMLLSLVVGGVWYLLRKVLKWWTNCGGAKSLMILGLLALSTVSFITTLVSLRGSLFAASEPWMRNTVPVLISLGLTIFLIGLKKEIFLDSLFRPKTVRNPVLSYVAIVVLAGISILFNFDFFYHKTFQSNILEDQVQTFRETYTTFVHQAVQHLQHELSELNGQMRVYTEELLKEADGDAKSEKPGKGPIYKMKERAFKRDIETRIDPRIREIQRGLQAIEDEEEILTTYLREAHKADGMLALRDLEAQAKAVARRISNLAGGRPAVPVDTVTNTLPLFLSITKTAELVMFIAGKEQEVEPGQVYIMLFLWLIAILLDTADVLALIFVIPNRKLSMRAAAGGFPLRTRPEDSVPEL